MDAFQCTDSWGHHGFGFLPSSRPAPAVNLLQKIIKGAKKRVKSNVRLQGLLDSKWNFGPVEYHSP
jgi:hypothetical protein